MTTMTATLLVDAVADITSESGRPLANGEEIYEWCARNGVDWGEHMRRRGAYFEQADLANAPNILRKFKKERVTSTSRNGWCLAEDWNRACAWTVLQAPRWQAVPWSVVNQRWIWQCSQRVDVSTPSPQQFDRNAIPCIRQHAATRQRRP